MANLTDGLDVTTWALIVLLSGVTPPLGTIQYGFETKQLCEAEAASYCKPGDTNPRPQFRCKCEKGLVPPGASPPPNPKLRRN
jgi:hypothetical protein